ncbi:hypothetical protein [Streptomyces sp. BH104]|uniref:hypothetical protein n=1 Tax=Streptomyces sp. BH104 TaxID=3410407 RepID=UPI003BB5BDD2
MNCPGQRPDCPDTPHGDADNDAVTGADTVRTPSESVPDGVRVEYRARVPRHLLGAALAEIDRARNGPPTSPHPGGPRT